ncbi:MAG: DUF6444 domain-containing protein [Aestuariivita sp.]|nr:DUF6444 domain-containing protein [Aestuariivita sp.]
MSGSIPVRAGMFPSDETGTDRSASRGDDGDSPVVVNASIRELEEPLQRQGERLSELERRLGLNSASSRKPPSSDGLRKPPASPKRGDGPRKKVGGQKGHDGMTLR